MRTPQPIRVPFKLIVGAKWAACAMAFTASARADVIQYIINAPAITASGSTVTLDGTQTSITTNLPGSSWVWGAGWNWGSPYRNATWSQPPVDSFNLREEKTALGISIADADTYEKPALLRIATRLRVSSLGNGLGGLGFWSAMPARSDTAHSFTNFTGIILNRANDTLQVYANNTYQGSAVNVGTIDADIFYGLYYDIDLASGAILNVQFNGNTVTGLTSIAFTDANTEFAGILSGTGSRAWIDEFSVAQIPEPGTMGMLALAAGLLGLFRRLIRRA